MDGLGDRMKSYEKVNRDFLIKRTPVIIRLDGKSFHTFTHINRVEKPFDKKFNTCMRVAALNIVENSMNAVFCYVQSDEISIFLKDWKNLDSEQWFGGNIQKIVSVSASMATMAFNRLSKQYLLNRFNDEHKTTSATFDARVFNIPKEEVVNYFVWRQQDATRNSIQGLGQSKFSHNEMQGKSNDEVQEMLKTRAATNWNDLEVWKKRGTTLFKFETETYLEDMVPPIFTKDRNYIERFID